MVGRGGEAVRAGCDDKLSVLLAVGLLPFWGVGCLDAIRDVWWSSLFELELLCWHLTAS